MAVEAVTDVKRAVQSGVSSTTDRAHSVDREMEFSRAYYPDTEPESDGINTKKKLEERLVQNWKEAETDNSQEKSIRSMSMSTGNQIYSITGT